MIIRRLTGEHWSEFLRKKIFEPLTMPTARMISYDEIIRNRADGYEAIEGKLKNREVIGPGWNTTADGSLLLSAPDLIKWSAAIKKNSLLNEESKRLMLSPTRLNDGSLATYGLGWFLGMDSGRRVAEHGGSGWGFRTYMGLFLDDSLTVIILANSTSLDPYLVGHKIAAMIRPSLEPPKAKVIRLPTKSLQDYAGDYKFVTGEIIHVKTDSDGLVITGIPLGKVVPEAKDRFFSPAWQGESKLIFVRDKDGRVQWLYTRRFSSSPGRATRVK
jgi:CubicO group peptidase (beta-lactamase class C family)